VTNGELVREILQHAGAMHVGALRDLMTDDVVMELPFAPGKMPKRYAGKDAVVEFQLFARDAFTGFSMEIETIHETADPHVVIAEHSSAGVVVENGREYRNRYVTVFTFDDDGRVKQWREYYDAGAVVRAFKP
jgi:ketosteroid isomerase-like protein